MLIAVFLVSLFSHASDIKPDLDADKSEEKKQANDDDIDFADEEAVCAKYWRRSSRDRSGNSHDSYSVFCNPRTPVSAVLGFNVRGVLSETGGFTDMLGGELALRFYRRVDLGVAAGTLFKSGGSIQVGSKLRWFLFRPGGGTYLGGGYVFKGDKQAFVTLGFFGGAGLFFEINFRESSRQPIAVIPEFGIRFEP